MKIAKEEVQRVASEQCDAIILTMQQTNRLTTRDSLRISALSAGIVDASRMLCSQDSEMRCGLQSEPGVALVHNPLGELVSRNSFCVIQCQEFPCNRPEEVTQTANAVAAAYVMGLSGELI